MGTDKDSQAWQNADEDEILARKMQDEEDALLARQLQDQDINDHHTQSAAQTDHKHKYNGDSSKTNGVGDDLPDYARYSDRPPPPAGSGSSGFGNDSTVTAVNAGAGGGGGGGRRGYHSNQVMEAGKLRAKDEQQMQNWLQTIQYQTGIYNSELEPEHESDWYCNCAIHQYQRAKIARAGVQDRWNKAVLYPGEKSYVVQPMYSSNLFSGNPYLLRTVSPYLGTFSNSWAPKQPSAKFHQTWITQTIALNNSLNAEAQKNVDGREPTHNIWGEGEKAMVFQKRLPIAGKGMDEKKGKNGFADQKGVEAMSNGNSNGDTGEGSSTPAAQIDDMPGTSKKPSKFSNFRKSIGIKTGEERQLAKLDKAIETGANLRSQILEEESGRWPDDEWRAIVRTYQDKIGMSSKIAQLRAHSPIQYLHLLRAGYFEPIPVAWATQASNPLKFSIEAAGGWRGITPAWRGYEDTAEERLYWVLNHREGSTGTRLKPDFISALDLARQRMASAVPPPPEYYDVNDTCHNQHKTDGYSNQVRPTPFKPFDRPEVATDDTMILLDVSGSMDFTPQRPRYDRYLIRGFDTSNQPKNRDLASAIIRRFVTAMENHDHSFGGYDLTTFSSNAKYIGTINEGNFEQMWSKIKFGGQTRVMTGWQKIKELHFEKHSESAIHHPLYGWQAGPETPILRLLLLLDGEASDMDEFELDLLGLSWAHVTIFLIGVDGCPHHHRHANELQRISDVNHHVSFVDAQGNTPERFVTHELLKRHLGYDLSLDEFKGIELPPSYQEATRS